jgi:hypothetical protein
MGRVRLAAALLILLVGTVAASSAAEIVAVTAANPLPTQLRLGGVIVPGDETAFHALALANPGALVVLSGPGGNVAAALAIGAEIHARGMATLVPAGAYCASACSLIWLAGHQRLLGAGARIGFHATSIPQGDGRRVETHAYDDVLRRYLDTLGLAADATATIVNTQAALVRWLDPIELRANGITADAYP